MKNSIKFENGSTLVAVLILLVVISFIAALAITNSLTNIKTGKNYSETLAVFNLAELGLAKAKLILKDADFTEVLNQYTDGIIIPETKDRTGTYTVYVKNNDLDASGLPLVDSDNVLVLRSKAIGNTGANVEIVVHVGKPDYIDFPDLKGAVVGCGTFEDLDFGGNSQIDGNDWGLPSVFDCNGNQCDESLVDPPAGFYGLIAQNDPSGELSGSDLDRLSGHEGPWWVDPELPCDEIRGIAVRLASMGEGPNVRVINSGDIHGNQTYGTRLKPQLTIFTTNGDTKISGNLEGAGVWVLSPGVGTLKISGDLYFEGVIILLGARSILDVAGDSNIFGSIVMTPTGFGDPGETLTSALITRGNSRIRFSSEAIALAENILNGTGSRQLITYNWQENY